MECEGRLLTFAGVSLCVALPDTALEEQSSLRDKTVKLGAVARSCSIFGVDLIQIFRDPRGDGEANLIKKVLQYLETPQYLRKKIFKLDESLKFAGLLPPLRIPSHKSRVLVERLRVGEFREGLVLGGNEVDVGLDETLRLRGGGSTGGRVTIRITSVSPLEGALVRRDEVGEYWGYGVEVKSVNDVLSDTRFKVKVATSRRGDRLEDCIGALGRSITDNKSVKLLFGSPSRGLFEIVGNDLGKRVDFVVNLFLQQHVATVRTEESIASALSLLNTILASGRTKV